MLFNKKWSPKLIFLKEKKILKDAPIFDNDFESMWYNFGTFCWTVYNINKVQFVSLRMLIFCKKILLLRDHHL